MKIFNKNYFSNKNKILAGIFILVLVLPSISYPFVKSKADIELNEKRELNKLSLEFDKFGEKFEDYYNDHIPFRSNLIFLYKKLHKGLGGLIPEAITPVVIENKVIYGKKGWLFYTGENSEDYYLGNNLLEQNELDSLLNMLVELDEYLISQNKKFVLQILPNKEQIYSEYMPSAYIVKNEYKRIDRIVDYIKANSNIKVVYPKEELILYKKKYQIYYKYDTHHNILGAYIAYSQLLKALNMAFVDLDLININIIKSNSSSFDLGDMILKKVNDDIDYFIDYKSDVNLLNHFNPFWNYDEYQSDSPNKETFLHIGDSFRNAQKQFIYKDFQKVISWHYENLYNDNSDAVKNAIKESDVIVFEVVERMDNSLFFASRILELGICTK